jgi:septum formation protein
MSFLPWIKKIQEQKIRVILGSGSAARKELFNRLSIPFEVRVSGFEEDLVKSDFTDKTLYPLATSRMKNRHILDELDGNVLLITCDTVIIRGEGDILEKPESPDDAFDVLKSLSGNTHRVVTGVVISLVVGGEVNREEFTETTHVTFHSLADDAVRAYIDSGEPFGKAGSYAIQGLGGVLVKKIVGSYDNVVGIPLERVADTMAEMLGAYVEIQR